MSSESRPTPVRFPRRTRGKISRVAKKIKLSKADTIRLAIDAGLPIVEKIPHLIDTEVAKILTGSK